jgi:hypothetical protein
MPQAMVASRGAGRMQTEALLATEKRKSAEFSTRWQNARANFKKPTN